MSGRPRIRSQHRGRVCLRVQERAGGSRIGAASRCARTTGRWQRISSVRYQARLAGSRLSVTVHARSCAQAPRRVDVASMKLQPTRRCKQTHAPLHLHLHLRLRRRRHPTSAPCPPPPPPPPPAATSASTAASSATTPASPPPPPPPPPARLEHRVGSQFHCNWGFYTNPDRLTVLDKLAATGVKWVRIDTSWAGIEDSYKGARNSWYIGMVDFCVIRRAPVASTS